MFVPHMINNLSVSKLSVCNRRTHRHSMIVRQKESINTVGYSWSKILSLATPIVFTVFVEYFIDTNVSMGFDC